MSASVAAEPGLRAPSDRRALRLCFVALVFVAAFAITDADHNGDTYWYGLDVSQRLTAPGHGRILEFAHLLWRPIAYVLYRAFGGIVEALRGPDLQTNVTWVMKAMAATGALASCLLMSEIMAGICGFGMALLLSASFACTNGILNAAHSGSSWGTGVAFLCASFLIAQRAARSARPAFGWAVGITAALSAVFWIPHIVGIASIFAFEFVWNRHDWALRSVETKARIRWMVNTAVACGVTLALIYGSAIVAGRIRSPQQLKEWVKRSANGNAQTDTLARAVSGIPRSFLDIGDDGLKLKRYYFKDPYAPVRKQDLLTGGIAGIAIFYLFFALLIWQLWRQRESWASLWLLLGSWALIFFLAVVVFEPGSQERYLPVYPITYIAIAQALRKKVSGNWGLIAIAGAVGPLLIVSNLAGLVNPHPAGEYAATLERRASLDQSIHGRAMATSLDGDPLGVLTQAHPLDLRLRAEHFTIRAAMSAGTITTKTWQRDFAVSTMDAWRNGDEVWISKRLLADRPKPEWRWIEGENGVLYWKDVLSYFRSFETDEESGSVDGFVRLAHSVRNEQLIGEQANQ